MSIATELADQIEQGAAKLLLTAERLDERERHADRLPLLIRDWHDVTHDNGFVTCPHRLCRAAQEA